jgi:NADPH-dependent 2,4-dienoyl-CoA reductase/sulfur reductase-like enzyme
MRITTAQRQLMKTFLPINYRQVVVARLKKRGITVHPNTVRNVLHGSENLAVAQELKKLADEREAAQNDFDKSIRQLSKEAA